MVGPTKKNAGRPLVQSIPYPPREKWVLDAAAYKKDAVACWVAYPPRERWVLDAAAYKTNAGRPLLAYTPRQRWVADGLACRLQIRLHLSRCYIADSRGVK